MSSLKTNLVFGILLASLSLSSLAQTNITANDWSNSRPSVADCTRNPSTPGCLDLLNSRERGNSGPEQIRVKEPSLSEQTRTNDDEGRSSGLREEVSEEQPTDFQEFVANGIGHPLPMFGYNLFAQVPSTFAPVDRFAVPADYLIGPGDELLIRAWGQIDVDARVTVDRTGSIYLPRIGSVTVAGLRYQQLPDSLKTAVGRIFKNFDLVVTLGQLRSIQVFVVGYARRPGVYTVGSLSTLVNTLFASGGPSNRGSMRKIQLKRNSVVVTTFDMYDLLLKGDKSKDVFLLPGDVIYIPPVGPQVALAGSVNVPAIYELAANATLSAQLDIAGGLTNVADGERAIVERIDGRSTRKVEEFKLDPAGLARELRDGDVIRLLNVSAKIENSITIRGNVARPGRYSWREGMRIRDLIPTKDALLTREFWDQQNAASNVRRFGTVPSRHFGNAGRESESGENSGAQSRREANGLTQQRTDTTKDNRNSDTIGRTYEEDTNRDEFRNEVKRSAPELNWEYAVIQRVNPNTLQTMLIPFNLGKAILEDDETENKMLMAGDIVTIFSQGDLSVPIEKQSKFVRLEGEFRAPGVYRVEPGETLQHLIERVGGITDKAYVFGSVFARETARIEQQHSLNEMVRNLELSLQRKTLTNAQRPEQAASLQAQNQADQMMLEKLRRVRASGRVVLEMKSNQGVESFPDIALEDGDRLSVPFVPSTVSVVGAVYNQNSFLLKSNTRIGNYLELAGSGTRDADMKRMFVVRADGSVISNENSGAWSGGVKSARSLPGDMIVVPAQTERGAFMRGLKDWSQVVSQFGLGIAAAYVFTK